MQAGGGALRGAVISGVLAVSAVHTSRGQDAPLDEIFVTGSRIARPDVAGASLVVTIDGDDLDATGAVSVAQALNRYPQFVAAATAFSNQPGNDGQANLSLRGLGVAQTLVLVDGRRLVGADGRGSVDVNVLPPTLIRSVDVVTGGASAVYGSDAVAGAVNIRLLDEYDGLQVDGQWAQSERGDGTEWSAGLTAGTTFGGGRGSIVTYVGHARRKQVDQGDRAFSRYPLNYFPDQSAGFGPGGAFLAGGSGITEEGVYVVFPSLQAFNAVFATYGYPAGTIPYQAGYGVNPDRTLFTIGDERTPGSVVNFRGERDPVLNNDRIHTYNYAPLTALQLPLERDTLYVRGHYRSGGDARVYWQALHTNYETTRQLAPVDAGVLLVPPTNPYVPADLRTLLLSRPNPNLPFRVLKRMTELGPRTAHNRRELSQATVGFTAPFGQGWKYDVYAQYGRNERAERQDGLLQVSRFEALVFAADGGASTCGGLDPFGKGSISAACADAIRVAAGNEATNEQRIVELGLTGPLASLPAGELRGAFGVLHKLDRYAYAADPLLRSFVPPVPGVIGERPDVVGLGVTADRGGEERNTDVYVELLWPLARAARLAHALDLGVGYRRAEYDRAGGADSLKVELAWSPTAAWRGRASYQRAVRAPSVDELYAPRVSGQFVVDVPDPCTTFSPQRTGPDAEAVAALCLAQGLPPERLASYEFVLRRIDGYSGGNPGLRTELADTYALGLAWRPTLEGRWRDVKVAIDAYRIDLDHAIGRWRADSAIARCYDPRYNPGYRVDNVYCTFFTRVPETGDMYATLTDRNLGGRETAGLDVQLDAAWEHARGRLVAQAYVNRVLHWKFLEPDGRELEQAGTIASGLGTTLPRWRALARLAHESGGLALGVRWEYTHSMRDASYPDFIVPATDYFHIEASYRPTSGPLDGLRVRFGIENVADEEPPIFPSWQQANTEPSVYDVLGRRYVVSLSYAF